jgi:hypothetical protein
VAAGLIVLIGGLFVNGCQISRLLSRSAGDSAQGTIDVSPRVVVDSALAGQTAPKVSSLAVINGGTWFATTASSWINVNPTRGASHATVRLSLDPQNLTPGLHIGSVTLQKQDSTGPPASVEVRFRIQQPVLVVKPGNFSFTPTSSNSVFDDTLAITNEGDGPLEWTATTANHASWLTLTNVAGAGPGKIAVRATNEGLPSYGTFTETIIVTATGAKNSPARIGVTLRRRKHDDATTP